jgi:hypothetical protein
MSTRGCPPGETVREHYAHGGKLFDEDLATPEHLLHGISRIEQLRQGLPEAVGRMAQVVADNPGQFALILAGTVVASQVAFNLMKPRSVGQALALMIVLNVGLPKLAAAAIERGWITFRVRDADGNLVPLVIGKADAPAAPQA